MTIIIKTRPLLDRCPAAAINCSRRHRRFHPNNKEKDRVAHADSGINKGTPFQKVNKARGTRTRIGRREGPMFINVVMCSQFN